MCLIHQLPINIRLKVDLQKLITLEISNNDKNRQELSIFHKYNDTTSVSILCLKFEDNVGRHFDLREDRKCSSLGGERCWIAKFGAFKRDNNMNGMEL